MKKIKHANKHGSANEQQEHRGERERCAVARMREFSRFLAAGDPSRSISFLSAVTVAGLVVWRDRNFLHVEDCRVVFTRYEFCGKCISEQCCIVYRYLRLWDTRPNRLPIMVPVRSGSRSGYW
ncbi:hypothetical protein [Variovorax sp. YR216]|uniref:hypothetical protein n=1 Tax=Variovorax sp. YR216 TaxID=1882828 RepID=UPI00089A4931|nr:hypothetical protein [Variovorax sp. YR216]SEB19839.1 hypothetical protein SAMN05444680_11311 [Variovorax sp. YR216]